MKKIYKAKDPFNFSTRYNLSESTGIKVSTVLELLMRLRQVPGACIYNHTHRMLAHHSHLSTEMHNDFAFWIGAHIGDSILAERISAVNIIEFDSIAALRDKLCSVIEQYAEENPYIKIKIVPHGKEFYFIKSISYIVPTGYTANDLKEFADILKKVDVNSMYHHIFEARLRLENSENDFSNWFKNSLGEEKLAEEISKLDPYCYALEDLRNMLVKMIENHFAGGKNDKN